MTDNVSELLSRRACQVEAALREWLADQPDVPLRLGEAIRYSIEAGGKRVRPALALECCALCGGQDRDALPAAAAIECVHTFSLIHDDLPAMDDDDLRRGRPTNHKVFGEAAAILAGDALLTLAFELIVRHAQPSEKACRMALTLARATGRQGMIGGQVLDLLAEGRISGANDATAAAPAGIELVRRIHEQKTARLIAAACRLGGLAADAAEHELAALEAYGLKLGLAFQAVDDLLDVTGTSRALGKTAGKDAAAGKQTLPRIVGVEEAWRIAELQAADAADALAPFGGAAAPLRELARFVVERAS
ncbi:MAG: polyprenyl synthetase family protein [Phycisphaerae bacterium]|nr:polyprenyl synthetase family protein [Phycisphaerae bacterium]NUQ45587.1 polyprenyl synthetase family protein [Phycisphaerae bacterium]